jgi:hypothetical protein
LIREKKKEPFWRPRRKKQMFRMDRPLLKAGGVSWRLIENKAVLLLVNEGLLLRLDDMATKIWLMIDKKNNGQDIIDYIAEHFDVENKRVEKDVKKFLKELVRNEAIEYT